MSPTDSVALRKARGAFFTPNKVARFITEWAVRSTTNAVIEPSCGEAVFLHQVGPRHSGRVIGVEIHAASARQAERTLKREGVNALVRVGDFLAHTEFGAFDAVVGNPPYVRYHGWTGQARAASIAAANPTSHASSSSSGCATESKP